MSKLYTFLLVLSFAAFSVNAQEINEICPSNSFIYLAEHLDYSANKIGYEDWAEFINSSGSVMNFSSFSLTDSLSVGGKWTFPPTILTSGEIIVLNFVENSEIASVVNFSLPKEGGALYLLSGDGIVLDSIHYPAVQTNDSYGKLGERYYLFDNPTPGATNETSTGYNGYSSQTSVNRVSGDYPAGTHIVFTAENENENVFIAINGQSAQDAIIHTAPYLLSKTVCIKAATKGDSLISPSSKTVTYFVDEQQHLPVINLTIDSLDLFDEVNGILMIGPDGTDYPPYNNANFWSNKEIEVHFSYFDQNLNLLDDLQCGLKIHGGSGSRIMPMKSFQLRAKDSFEESDFTANYFDSKTVNAFKRLVLRNSGNDFCKTSLKDGMLQDYFLKSNLNIDLMAYTPVSVYLNGKYWGLMNLREKTDRYYLASNYAIDPNTVNLLEKKDAQVINGSNESFIALTNYAKENDLSAPEHYEKVDQELDIESMVDYFCIQFYINNRDWPHNNLKIWNAPEQKWRFLCYDLDYGLKYYWDLDEPHHTVFQTINALAESNLYVRLFVELLANKEFRRYFINRYADLLNTIFQPQEIQNAIEHAKSRIEPAIEKHYNKWCGPIQEWDEYIKQASTFTEDRVEIEQADLKRTFNLTELAHIKIDNYPNNGGTVQVNSILIEAFPFECTYFESNPISLSAIPNAGYVFDYWENERNGEKWYSPNINIDPKNKDDFIAVYKSESNLFHLSVSPNPVADILYLNYSLPTTGHVTIALTTLAGQEIALSTEPQLKSKGSQSAEIDLTNLSSGLYLLHVTAEEGQEVIRIFKE